MSLDVFHVHGSYFTIVDHFMGQSELLYVYPISNNAASERFISAWHDAWTGITWWLMSALYYDDECTIRIALYDPLTLSLFFGCDTLANVEHALPCDPASWPIVLRTIPYFVSLHYELDLALSGGMRLIYSSATRYKRQTLRCRVVKSTFGICCTKVIKECRKILRKRYAHA